MISSGVLANELPYNDQRVVNLDNHTKVTPNQPFKRIAYLYPDYFCFDTACTNRYFNPKAFEHASDILVGEIHANNDGTVQLPENFAKAIAAINALNGKHDIYLVVTQLDNIVGNPGKIANFTADLGNLYKKYPSLRGINWDWEYGANSDWQDTLYENLIVQVYNSFIKNNNLSQSIAVSVHCPDWLTSYHYDKWLQALAQKGVKYKYVNLMSYGGIFNVLTAQRTAEDALDTLDWLNANSAIFTKQQIFIGLPLYGTYCQDGGFTCSDYKDEWYNDLINAGCNYKANVCSYQNQRVYYNGISLIADKVRQFEKDNFGGVFEYRPALDTEYDSPGSIIRTIDNNLETTPNR